MSRILVTPRSATLHGHPAVDRLAARHDVILGPRGRQPEEAELLQLLPGCAGYLAGVEPISARVLNAATGLRVISRNGSGIDNIDGAAAAARGIEVLRAEGANARGVAELALGLILALARHLPRTDATLKRGSWTRHEGIELEGKTVGLIGYGRVGRLVGRLVTPLGVSVLAHDPIAAHEPERGNPPRFCSLEELLAEADIVSLHCPAPPDALPLLDQRRLGLTRPGVMIINTARAELIDDRAMLAALDSGHVAGLALDVYREEPAQDLTLVAHPRVIATPHLGGYTRESVDRALHAAATNLLQSLN